MTADLDVRELRGDDLFTLLSIIGKLDIVDDAVPVVVSAMSGGGLSVVGVQAAGVVLKAVLTHADAVRDELHGLLADLTGTDVETIRSLGAAAYVRLVKRMITGPGMIEVFTSLGSLATEESDASETSGGTDTAAQVTSSAA